MPSVPFTTSQRAEMLLSDPAINRQRNDLEVYGRPGPGGGPSPLFGQQYRYDVREARKLCAAIPQRFTKNAQKAIVRELARRAGPAAGNAKGGLKISENAAKELNKLAQSLGLSDVKFKSGQPYPSHPVG